MAIPKIIYQTFKMTDIPFLTKWAIGYFLQRNKAYHYEFYDDKRIVTFFERHFDTRINKTYRSQSRFFSLRRFVYLRGHLRGFG